MRDADRGMKLSDKIRIIAAIIAAVLVVAGIAATLYAHMSAAGATFWTGIAVAIVGIFLVAVVESIEMEGR